MGDKLGETFKLFKLLSENDINIDIIVQSHGEYMSKDVSFSLQTAELQKTLDLLQANAKELNYKEMVYSKDLAKISLVGLGLESTPGIAAQMFESLSENNINMHMISTSEIRISVLVDETKSKEAMQAIHDKLIK